MVTYTVHPTKRLHTKWMENANRRTCHLQNMAQLSVCGGTLHHSKQAHWMHELQSQMQDSRDDAASASHCKRQCDHACFLWTTLEASHISGQAVVVSVLYKVSLIAHLCHRWRSWWTSCCHEQFGETTQATSSNQQWMLPAPVFANSLSIERCHIQAPSCKRTAPYSYHACRHRASYTKIYL